MHQKRVRWVWGKGSSPDNGGHGAGCPEQWSQNQASGFQGISNNTLRIMIWTVGDLTWRQKLNTILMGLFQLKILYDSMVPITDVILQNMTTMKYHWFELWGHSVLTLYIEQEMQNIFTVYKSNCWYIQHTISDFCCLHTLYTLDGKVHLLEYYRWSVGLLQN